MIAPYYYACRGIRTQHLTIQSLPMPAVQCDRSLAFMTRASRRVAGKNEPAHTPEYQQERALHWTIKCRHLDWVDANYRVSYTRWMGLLHANC
jgi:hypothetical protein